MITNEQIKKLADLAEEKVLAERISFKVYCDTLKESELFEREKKKNLKFINEVRDSLKDVQNNQ